MLVAAAIGSFAVGLASLVGFALLLSGAEGTVGIDAFGLSLESVTGTAVAAVSAAFAAIGVAAFGFGAALLLRGREQALYRARMDTAAYNARLEVRNRLLEQQATTLEDRLEDLNRRMREIEERDVVQIPEPETPLPMKDHMRFPRVPEDTTLEDVRRPGVRPAQKAAGDETSAASRRPKRPFPRLPDDVVVLPDADDPERKRRTARRRRKA